MPRRRTRSLPLEDWPPTLRYVIRAVERECPRGHADALIELTALALHKVPARGIFDPSCNDDHELFRAIESVAKAHLELETARNAWRSALDSITMEMSKRDDLEMAALHIQSVSDTAYYYAGLAFGLIFVTANRP